MPDDAERTLQVVVWRADGEAVATPAELERVPVDFSDASSLPRLLEEVRDRTGATVSLLDLTDDTAHVELAGDSEAPPLGWSAPDTPIGGSNPWNRIGWYRATLALIEETLRLVGATPVGPVVQRKHWSISALLSVETDDGAFWFKQVPPFMAHEGALMRTLARLKPEALPEVVAVGSDWCLMRGLAEPAQLSETENAFGVLAELQQAATPLASELLELGCPDRRPPQLRADLEALSERSDLLDGTQRERLARVLPRALNHIGALEDTIPPTIVHGDLHGGNWSLDRASGQWVIFDWTDGCLAHPFMDLGVLPRDDEARRHARLESYLAVWRSALDESLVQRVLSDALPAAAAFHAVSYQRIIDGVRGDDAVGWNPAVASYLGVLFELLDPSSA